MRRRYARTILSFAWVAALLSTAACSRHDASSDDKIAAGEPDARPVTYRMLKNASFISGYPDDGGPYKPVILDKAAAAGITGVDYSVTIASGLEYDTKLNVMAASGMLPDYFNVDIPTMIKYADEGRILPLDDLLATYAPHLTKLQNAREVEALRYKGKIWAVVPGYRPEPFNGPSTGGYNYRKDWLERMNMKVPTDLNELHDVLRAFTFGDPDGNGKNDTYGLSVGRSTSFSGIFGAFGIQPKFWMERGGRLRKGFTLPEAKEALRLLHDWYREGIIDPDFPTNETKQLDEKVVNSKAGVWEGTSLGVVSADPRYAALRKANPGGTIGFMAPPKGPGGQSGFPESSPGIGQLRAISAKAPHPEKLMKLIDWSADDSAGGGFYLLTFGEEGKHYTYDKEKNLITQLVSYTDLYKEGLSNPVRFVVISDRRYLDSQEARQAVEKANATATKNAYWQTTPSMLDYPDLEEKLWPETMLKIILGQLPVDAWDEFVQKYDEQGGNKIEDEVNAAWNREKAARH